MDETDYFEQCFREEELTAADIENLRIAVLSKYFKRAVKVCLEASRTRERQLAAADLTSPGGVSEALKTQGQIQGMQFILSELYVLATEEPEPKTEEEIEDGRE